MPPINLWQQQKYGIVQLIRTDKGPDNAPELSEQQVFEGLV
jgi:hypothetical protein